MVSLVCTVLAFGGAGPGALSAAVANFIALRLIGISVEAVFDLLRAVLFLPARLLGFRKDRS